MVEVRWVGGGGGCEKLEDNAFSKLLNRGVVHT